MRFSADRLKGFRQEDINTIRDMMKPYRYGKDLERMLRPETRVRALFHRGRVAIRNYDYLDLTHQDQPLGVCHDLAWDLLKKLKAHFGKRYHFELVNGQSASYFTQPGDNHLFVMGWTPEQDKQVRAAFYNKSDSMLDHALVFDPSFQVAAEDSQTQAYKPDSILKPLPANITNPEIEDVTFFPELDEDTASSVPLGYLSDLDNAFTPDHNAKILVDMGFAKSKGSGKPFIALFKSDDSTAERQFWADWSRQLHPDSLLMRFIRKLEADLETPDPDLAVMLDKKLDSARSMSSGSFHIRLKKA